jgi:endonuclease YncB( thermonuclease family)
MRHALVTLLAAAVLALAGAQTAAAARVDHVIDGDTIALTNGERVRLVQIDSTELGSGECYSRKAAQVLRSLLPEGTAVRLEADPRLDPVDSYGRLLRYVHRGRLNVNVELVRRGAATVWFYHGDRGRYAARLLAAAERARDRRLGMWRSCHVQWDPTGPATTAGGGSPPPAPSPPPASTAEGCAAGYSPCLPIVSDLDCGDIADELKPIRVTGDDPYRLDGEGDGWGCEDG